MRIPLPTDIKTRTGAPSDKDARQKNSYVETKGEEAIVRKRPSAQGGIATGTGVAQGGIGLNINGTPYFIGFWADTMQIYAGGANTWDAGYAYSGGQMVVIDFENYWSLDEENNINKDPLINYRGNPYGATAYWVKGASVPFPPLYVYSGNVSGVAAGGSNVGDVCESIRTQLKALYPLYTWTTTSCAVGLTGILMHGEGPSIVDYYGTMTKS